LCSHAEKLGENDSGMNTWKFEILKQFASACFQIPIDDMHIVIGIG
jgi:hypothetical protein